MELEFDKEMDAILRKARGGVGVSSHTSTSHLDADSIAAFVENALPRAAKLLYTGHFADCDRCRKQLSFAMSMNSEAEQTAASVISASVIETVVPWYQKLFKSQNLAIAMGALVLSFSALIGYLALQNSSRQADIAMSTNKVSSVVEPSPNSAASNTVMTNTANVSAPVTNTARANTQSNSGIVMPVPGTKPPADSTARTDATAGTGKGEGDNGFSLDGASTDAAKPVAPPPPASTAGGQPGVVREESETTKLRDEDINRAERKIAEDRSMKNDSMSKVATKRANGPSRASVNVQQESNLQNMTVLGSGATRQIGGKTFDNRSGVWYDLAYNGQSTKTVRRGTSDYKNLDGGLKNIAENLSGTVVVAWKQKAYRIQ